MFWWSCCVLPIFWDSSRLFSMETSWLWAFVPFSSAYSIWISWYDMHCLVAWGYMEFYFWSVGGEVGVCRFSGGFVAYPVQRFWRRILGWFGSAHFFGIWTERNAQLFRDSYLSSLFCKIGSVSLLLYGPLMAFRAFSFHIL